MSNPLYNENVKIARDINNPNNIVAKPIYLELDNFDNFDNVILILDFYYSISLVLL